uniref:Uncharacterized protein n=1 Tax=Anguilla anguilla TaxID=7936 RepID=A0A0E9WBE7_ANGAN
MASVEDTLPHNHFNLQSILHFTTINSCLGISTTNMRMMTFGAGRWGVSKEM